MVKQIFEVELKPCLGNYISRSTKLDMIAKRMFGNQFMLLFSKRRDAGIPIMKKRFIRKVYNEYKNYTQKEIADYLGYKGHYTVNYHLKND